jgi:nucleoside 2-deoxyribosyltransferase
MIKQKVYLAGPGFSKEERELNLRYMTALTQEGYEVFSPFDHVRGDMKTPEGRKLIFDDNLNAILNSYYMLASLDWTTVNGKFPTPVPDTGTIWEIGRASELNKIIGVTSDPSHGVNVMIFYGIHGFVAGADRFLEALKKHHTLDVFIGKKDNPAHGELEFY